MNNVFNYVLRLDLEVPEKSFIQDNDVYESIKNHLKEIKGGKFDIVGNKRKGLIGEFNIIKTSPQLIQIGIPMNLNFKNISSLCAHLEVLERISIYNVKLTFNTLQDLRKEKEEFVQKRSEELENIFRRENDFPTNENWSSFIVEKNGFQVGSEFDSDDEVIIVEGAYDARTLLVNNWKNFLILGGNEFDILSLKSLVGNKVITLFLDGDNMGKRVTRYLVENMKIDFVITANKTVESLDSREVQKFIRSRVPTSIYLRNLKNDERFDRLQQGDEGYNWHGPLFELAPQQYSVYKGENVVSTGSVFDLVNPFTLESDSEYTFIFNGILNKYLFQILKNSKYFSNIYVRDVISNSIPENIPFRVSIIL